MLFRSKTYFELLIDEEQKFTVETDTLDYVAHIKVTGSNENKLFNDHQKFLMQKGLENQDLKARLDANKNNKDSAAAIKKKITAIDQEVKDYRLNIIKNYPKSFMAKILKTMQEPDVPENPKDEKGNVIDSTFQFRYFKTHFLEKIGRAHV